MRDLVLQLDQSPPVDPEDSKKQHSQAEDLLGSMLQGKWSIWSNNRRNQEQIWLEDLRAFNQQNDPGDAQLSKFHSHIYIGLTRTKATGSYNRIEDLYFQSRKHWGIAPTPVPECDKGDPMAKGFMDAMQKSAELMETEISDQLLDLKYESKLKSCILEGCIIGTGVIKGIIPGTRKIEKWGFTSGKDSGVAEWRLVKSEIPFPELSAPSVFDVFPDPYSNCVEDMSGVFERHVLNRAQVSELKDDSHFNEEKIKEILAQSENGNHANLYHETERRNIANAVDTTSNGSGKYDLLEYWGQVSGRLLQAAGVEDSEEYETYWANVWTCSGKTLLARVMPMKRQRIPYNFFIYSRQPHQFWGVGPGRMMRNSQKMMNGATRLLLDGLALAAIPMSETNVTMLQDGQDPTIMQPGQNFLRDSGDPSVPAVRFFQPNIPTGALMQMSEFCKQLASEESNIPAFSYGVQSEETNKTSSGLGMQLNAASGPIKAVGKSLEDQVIKPVIESLYDWNMQWGIDDSIKGDHEVQVLGSGQMIAKEQKAQSLMQFANITMNPLDLQFVDRKYNLQQIANSLELDIAKLFPDQLPPQQMPPAPPTPSPTEIAKADLIQAQAKQTAAVTEKTEAEKTESIIRGLFASIQAGNIIATNPEVAPVADSIFKSAGGKDLNGAPLVDTESNPVPMILPQNNHPSFPTNPTNPAAPMSEMQGGTPMNNVPAELKSPGIGVGAGIETARNEPLATS
jgi:hypothetical protein